jgi:UDP-N-acetylmuramyl pentapeptide phosphotransferase/UDP-N-acetylglucosamine-1-phosphate transferase
MADIATASLVLSGLVLLVALGLSWREWSERRSRGDDLSTEDARHYRYQDSRRLMGIVILVLLAVGLVVGSRVPIRLGPRANPRFLGIWLGVFALIGLLLFLALVDWVALRVFARRHRGRILRERIEILKEEQRRRKSFGAEGNGHADGPFDDPLG